MSQFIHNGWKQPLLFMMILVGHEFFIADQYNWGQHINSTVDKRLYIAVVTYILQYTSFLHFVYFESYDFFKNSGKLNIFVQY